MYHNFLIIVLVVILLFLFFGNGGKEKLVMPPPPIDLMVEESDYIKCLNQAGLKVKKVGNDLRIIGEFEDEDGDFYQCLQNAYVKGEAEDIKEGEIDTSRCVSSMVVPVRDAQGRIIRLVKQTCSPGDQCCCFCNSVVDNICYNHCKTDSQCSKDYFCDKPCNSGYFDWRSGEYKCTVREASGTCEPKDDTTPSNPGDPVACSLGGQAGETVALHSDCLKHCNNSYGEWSEDDNNS